MTALTQRLEHLHGGELGSAAGVGRHHTHDLHAPIIPAPPVSTGGGGQQMDN